MGEEREPISCRYMRTPQRDIMMRLYKVHIRTYCFGLKYYDLFVLANNESNMLRQVYAHPLYHRDGDAEIVNYEEINLNDTNNRVL